MSKVYLIVFSMVMLSAISCSKPDANIGCSFTVDTVSIIDSLSIDGKTYFLVHRISGFQEKIESFELFDSRPIFDRCSKSNIAEVFGASLENEDRNNNDQHVTHVILNVTANVFDLKYEPGRIPELDHNKNLSLELTNY